MKSEGLQYTTLLRDELQAVHTTMLEIAETVPDIVAAAITGIIDSGGKRLRPALVLLSAHIFGASTGNAIPIAAATEMLHTATLIHDDLIDNARIRRGTETLNVSWTPAATVLTGDIAFAWSAKLATRGDNLALVQHFSETLQIICNGELNQMFAGKGHIPTETAYFDRIFAKTASLFALCARVGPILTAQPERHVAQMYRFGKLLGEAFQIVDDVLDFMGDEAILGKPVASDLRQGLITLPVLHYYRHHPDDARIRAALTLDAGDEAIRSLVDALRSSDAVDWAMEKVAARITEALGILAHYPDSPYRQALEEMATFAARRRY